MTVTFGFFNSLNNDRVYNAVQMSSIFDGIISDGVYLNFGNALMVVPSTGMDIIVGSGRAWFKHTWTYNDTDLVLTVDTAEAVLARIDAVVLEIDSSDAVRANTIKMVKGTPGSSVTAITSVNLSVPSPSPATRVTVL